MIDRQIHPPGYPTMHLSQHLGELGVWRMKKEKKMSTTQPTPAPDKRPSTVLADMGKRIIADGQHNDHYTAYPIFLVQSRKRVYGIDTEYDPLIEWQHGDDCTALDPTQSQIAEAFFQETGWEPKFICNGKAFVERLPDGAEDRGDDYVSNLRRLGYAEYWDFVQPFFTREAAEYYIATNSHHHRMRLRVYVDSAYRNWEWQAIRAYLVEEGKKKSVGESEESL